MKEKKEAQPTMTSKIWEATAFNQDLDGKMTAKFKRMMGIKTEQGSIVFHDSTCDIILNLI